MRSGSLVLAIRARKDTPIAKIMWGAAPRGYRRYLLSAAALAAAAASVAPAQARVGTFALQQRGLPPQLWALQADTGYFEPDGPQRGARARPRRRRDRTQWVAELRCLAKRDQAGLGRLLARSRRCSARPPALARTGGLPLAGREHSGHPDRVHARLRRRIVAQRALDLGQEHLEVRAVRQQSARTDGEVHLGHALGPLVRNVVPTRAGRGHQVRHPLRQGLAERLDEPLLADAAPSTASAPSAPASAATA